MSSENFEYDYHSLVDDVDFIDDDSFIYEDEYADSWDNYYHNITEELDEEH